MESSGPRRTGYPGRRYEAFQLGVRVIYLDGDVVDSDGRGEWVVGSGVVLELYLGVPLACHVDVPDAIGADELPGLFEPERIDVEIDGSVAVLHPHGAIDDVHARSARRGRVNRSSTKAPAGRPGIIFRLTRRAD